MEKRFHTWFSYQTIKISNLLAGSLILAIVLGGCAQIPRISLDLKTLLNPILPKQASTSVSTIIPELTASSTTTIYAESMTYTLTPFQPLPITATPSATPTPTQTPTSLPTSTFTPIPLPTHTNIPKLPDSAIIPGVYGQPQLLTLSCESRSAVDLAAFVGVHIGELEFLYALPVSDNPDKGFVGNANGSQGQVPPNSYGVHAKPVAALLREFGVPAKARRDMKVEDLKYEISAGRPIIAWVIFNLGYSVPQKYTDAEGETTIVARYEHTVIVFGYDENTVTVLDNDRVLVVSWDVFMRSWNVLGNMAVVLKTNKP